LTGALIAHWMVAAGLEVPAFFFAVSKERFVSLFFRLFRKSICDEQSRRLPILVKIYTG
jgi:hypothetical protein